MLIEPLNEYSLIAPFHPNPEPPENTSISQLTKYTIKFLQETLPFFPQYTYNHSEPNPEPNKFVDEHVLIATLHWTSYYHFTNPLALPLLNTAQDIERNKTELFKLTTALTP